MDLRENDEFGMEKRSADHASYQSPGLSAEWQFGNQPIVSGDTPATTVCSSVSVVDTFCSNLWNNPTNLQSLGFCDANVPTNTSSSGSGVPVGKPVQMPPRLDMGGVFLPTVPGGFAPSISHLPTDPAFIERAARFSSFNGSNYSRMVNPISTPESMSPYSNASRGASGAHGSKSNDSGEPEFSGSGQEGTPNLGGADGDSSSQGISVKKRKRSNQEMESDQVEGDQQSPAEAAKESVDTKQKAEQSSSKMATAKPSGKQAKDNSDSPKEDCVHMRARRGQATNSHSLAERVRREKISERMKFLQELVPGCSKVTGKAVMLDEIINYVQSLQRQVEFLSMKLAAVNPRLDFNIEGLLSKHQFLQSRGISSSTMEFSLDMIHPQSHLPQQSLIQAGMSGITHPSDALRRAINAQFNMINGYKEPPAQMPGTWDDELHNVIQMNFDTNNPPLNTEGLDGKPRDGFPI